MVDSSPREGDSEAGGRSTGPESVGGGFSWKWVLSGARVAKNSSKASEEKKSRALDEKSRRRQGRSVGRERTEYGLYDSCPVFYVSFSKYIDSYERNARWFVCLLRVARRGECRYRSVSLPGSFLHLLGQTQAQAGQKFPSHRLEIHEQVPTLQLFHSFRILDADAAQVELADVLPSDIFRDSKRAWAVHASRTRVRAEKTSEWETRPFSARHTRQSPTLGFTPFLEGALRCRVPTPRHQPRVPCVARGKMGEYFE